MRALKSLSLVAVLTIVGAVQANAQSRPRGPLFPTRFTIAGDLLVAQPKGEFGSNIDQGFGANVVFLYKLDKAGVFSLRADLGGMEYGSETKRVPFLPYTGRVLLDVTTTNDVYFGAIGPQMQLLTKGPVRPYVNAAVGVQGFVTESALSGSDESWDYASTTNSHDATLAYMLGGGLYIPFGKSATAASLNIGARYHFGGTASYLREGDITDNADGTITLHPRNTKTDMVMWQVGVSVPIPTRR
jgi:hypothetical protein